MNMIKMASAWAELNNEAFEVMDDFIETKERKGEKDMGNQINKDLIYWSKEIFYIGMIEIF